MCIFLKKLIKMSTPASLGFIERALLGKKFRGCLLGALLGDCFGQPFEFQTDDVSPVVLQKFMDKFEGPRFKTPKYAYTDDTAMTKCIAQSFIEKGALDSTDLAKKFVTEYVASPRRGYGMHVTVVFEKLKATKFIDVTQPAREQFNGFGSYGNGGAMRISPVALFCYGNFDLMIDTAKQSTEITHTHPNGINGAILQCCAVWQSLQCDPNDGPLNTEKFADDLIKTMDVIETPDEIDGTKAFKSKLQEVKKLLKREGASVGEVQDKLGNDVSALMSVPTAIYCFLRAQHDIPGIITDNPFRRTIQYAILIGGDTDTIASMAGSIAGAYYGEDAINNSLIYYCEAADEMVEYADSLYNMVK